MYKFFPINNCVLTVFFLFTFYYEHFISVDAIVVLIFDTKIFFLQVEEFHESLKHEVCIKIIYVFHVKLIV